jgi:glycopeptide antibiotics resistance protein
MKKINNVLITSFHLINLIIISFYLYPGSIVGYVVYGDFTKQPEISEGFSISLNHFFVFLFLSILGILAYQRSNKINILIKYLFFISIILECVHIVIPLRAFEIEDLLGNILGTLLIVGIYKLKKKYA